MQAFIFRLWRSFVNSEKVFKSEIAQFSEASKICCFNPNDSFLNLKQEFYSLLFPKRS